jgi:hypothetical protein
VAAYAGTPLVATVDDSTYTPVAGIAYTSLPPGHAANCTVAFAAGQESTRPVCGVSAALRSATVFGSPLSVEALAAAATSSLELSPQAASVASSAQSAMRE